MTDRLDPGEVLVVFGPPRSGKSAFARALAEERQAADVVMIDESGHIVRRRRLRAMGATKTSSARGDRRRRPSDDERETRWERSLNRSVGKAPGMLVIDLPPSAALADPLAFAEKLGTRLSGFAGATALTTDDAAVALALADRISVVEDGGIVQSGTLAEIADRPRTKYAARLAGVNFFTGLGRGGRLSIGHSSISAPTEKKGRVLITLPPAAVTVFASEPADAGADVFEARIAHLASPGAAPRSPDDVLNLGLSPANPEHGLELTATVPRQDRAQWKLGQRVFARVDTRQLTAYDF